MKSTKNKYKVCLLEDDDFFKNLYTELLLSLDCEVVPFSRIGDFLSAVQGTAHVSEFDLLWIDRFFDSEGIDVLNIALGITLKTKFNYCNPVVLCSCVAVPSEIYLKAGFDFFLKKEAVRSRNIKTFLEQRLQQKIEDSYVQNI